MRFLSLAQVIQMLLKLLQKVSIPLSTKQNLHPATHTAQEYKTSTNSSEADAYEANTTCRKNRALFAKKDSKGVLHMRVRRSQPAVAVS